VIVKWGSPLKFHGDSDNLAASRRRDTQLQGYCGGTARESRQIEKLEVKPHPPG
jgi:hypothetical protein